MESDFNTDNVLETVFPYRILRNVQHADGGTYPVQMNLKAGMDQKYAEEVTELLDGLGMLQPMPDSDPQVFQVRYEGLIDRWYELWEDEIGQAPVTPENFDEFLKKYIKSYMRTERNSTIKEMLVENFYIGLKTVKLNKDDEFMDKSYEELQARMEEEYEGKDALRHHIDDALGFREEKKR